MRHSVSELGRCAKSSITAVSRYNPPMRQKVVMMLALVGMVVALWPPVGTLYELTGEETAVSQVRGLVHWFNSAIRPQPQFAAEEVATRSVPLYGVNTFLEQEVEIVKREQSLQLVQAAGFGLIRQVFPWEDIEIHGKGDFVDRRNDPNGVDAWAKYDNIVLLAEQYDIQILARLSNPPAWTRALTNTVGSHAPPDNLDDYGDFVAAVAERYNGRISHFQIWNEPNIYPEWGEQNVDPEAYTALLCTAYERIKAINPQAVVVTGAMAPTVAMDGRNMNDLIFLQRMYNAGAGACFDVLAAQGYGLWSGAMDRRLRPTVINFPHHLLLRDLMVQNGDATKPMWISEMGWNVVPDSVGDKRFGQVTEAQQASYAVEAYQRAATEWPWVGNVAYWFFKRPSDSEKNQSWYYFRLMEPDFRPLPVYGAVAEMGKVISNQYSVDSGGKYRPFLFAISLAAFFFMWLDFAAPSQRE